jgi:hypothetical protein
MQTDGNILYAIESTQRGYVLAGPYTSIAPVKAFFNKKVKRIQKDPYISEDDKQIKIQALFSIYKVVIYTPSLVISSMDIGNLTHDMVKERVCI